MRNRPGGTGVYLDVADFDAARDELTAAGWAMDPRWTVPQDAAILRALSQRVAERCGFTREGVLRSHIPFRGGRRDTVLFSLLPTELR